MPIVRQESPTEMFRELVESAMARQHVAAGARTAFYVVNLLATRVRHAQGAREADGPLGVRLATALHAEGLSRREGLREVGDRSLFLAGFFADSLTRRLVDVDYYTRLGERAYARLADEGDGRGDIFEELAERFDAFVDVLSEVSERTSLTSNADLLRLYERWLRTGSRHTGELLAGLGVVPSQGARSRHLH